MMKKLPQDKAHLPILRHPSDDNNEENGEEKYRELPCMYLFHDLLSLN